MATCDQFLALLSKKTTCFTTAPLLRETLQDALDASGLYGSGSETLPADVVAQMSTLCQTQLNALFSPSDDCFNDHTRAQTACAPPSSEPATSLSDRGIREIDNDHFGLSRALVDSLIADPSKLTTHDMLHKLGLPREPSVHAVNGIELASVTEPRELIAKLNGADELRVDWFRDGKPTTSHYAICNRLIPEDEAAQDSDWHMNSPLSFDQEQEIDIALRDNTQTTDATHYEVMRPLGAKVGLEPSAFLGNVRAVPAIEQGKSRGVILYAVTRSPLLSSLGLLTGDIVRAVNGVEITAADKALAVVAMAQREASLRIDITRNGAPTMITISIHDDALPPRQSLLSPAGLPSVPGASAEPPRSVQVPTKAIGVASSPSDIVDPKWQNIIDRGIHCLDDTHCVIARSIFTKVLNDTSLLTRGARIVPAVKHGTPDGYKIYAIKPNSLFARLKLSNGDSIHSINGIALATEAESRAVLRELDGMSTLEIEITRRGESMTVYYSID